jgi:HK97 family phage prohead protease
MTQKLTEPVRKDIMRSVPFSLTRDTSGGSDGLTLDGYAAVFDSPTRIDSWEGTFNEQIARGAFKKSLSERTPVLQFDHGSHPMVGSIPIGSIRSIVEDKHGLHVTARLEDNWLMQPVRDAIDSGSVDGMSFRFEVVRDEWRTDSGDVVTDVREIVNSFDSGQPLTRTLLEVKCRELGPVVFPAYADTSVGGRSLTLDLARLHEPEQRRELARAVWMAERGAAPEGTDQAADHATQTDAPQATDSSAGEHESTPAEPTGLRSNLAMFLRTRRIVVENANRKGI